MPGRSYGPDEAGLDDAFPTRPRRESMKPLFRWSSGQVIKRIEIQAAVGVGLPPDGSCPTP